MDISKYRKYVRNMEISDKELEEILTDTINDIARDTKIFKDFFGVRFTSCEYEYDLKAMYEFNLELNEDAVINDVLVAEDDDGKSRDYVSFLVSDKKTCELYDDDILVEKEQRVVKGKHTFLSVDSIIYIRNENDDYKGRIINLNDGQFMKILGNGYAVLDTIKMEATFGSTYDLYSLVAVNIVPDFKTISDEMLMIMNDSIVKGLKYQIADMYNDVNNEQGANLQYQRYYSAKKQLLYNYPQLSFPSETRNKW